MDFIEMNEQTIFVTFEGSSTLEFTDIKNVPVYEPAPHGLLNVTYDRYSITTIDHTGYVERIYLRTGRIERWFTRPSIANVITMGMQCGVKGYCYEFKTDGSIRSSSPKGTYYWGPIRTMKNPDERICVSQLNPNYANVDREFLMAEHVRILYEHDNPEPYECMYDNNRCPGCRREGVCMCYT